MPAPSAHPERSTLFEFAAGQLDETSAGAVERHLRRCTACRALVASAPAPAAIVDATAAVLPTPEDAVAAAELTAGPTTSLGNSLLDELVTRPLNASDAPTVVQPAVGRTRSTRGTRIPIRTRRIIAAILAILIIALLAVTAWFVTTDDWRDARDDSRSNEPTRTVRFDTQQV